MSRTNGTIRVGIVGAGNNTRNRHIPGLKAQPDVELVSVVNRSRQSSERAAAEHGIGRVHDHWRELVEADDVDAVLIGTWPYLHRPVTLAALAAGKHVLTEARLALNLAEAREMLAASRARPDLVTQVVPAAMTLGMDATICRHIAGGYVGDVLAVEHLGGGGFIDREAPAMWRDSAVYSGLNIGSLGITYETIMRWVGPATRVAAIGKTFVATRRDDAGVAQAMQLPDHLEVLADMACGATLHLQLSSVMGHGMAGTTIYGSEGTLRIAGGQLLGARRDDDALAPLPVPAAKPRPGELMPPGWRVEEEFCAAIRGEGAVERNTFEIGVQYMAFTEAVHRSMAEGRTAPVER